MENKKIAPPQYLRLKENHPTMVKFLKLIEFAEELKIQLSFYSDGIIGVEDEEKDLPGLHLTGIEGNDQYVFPPSMEYKMIYENPAYIAFKLEKDKLWQEQVRKENKEKKERELKEKQMREAEAANRLRDEEIKQLTYLKAKYEQSI